MFQVGDLVRYEDVELANDIPGVVLAVVLNGDYEPDHLEIQWFDWLDGSIAKEDPLRLIVISSVSEGK
jgi:hypothetical protein